MLHVLDVVFIYYLCHWTVYEVFSQPLLYLIISRAQEN